MSNSDDCSACGHRSKDHSGNDAAVAGCYCGCTAFVPPEKPIEKPYDASHLAALLSATGFAVGKLYLDKFFDLGERLVKAVERNADATEKLASTVTTDRLASGEQGTPYVRVGGEVVAKKF